MIKPKTRKEVFMDAIAKGKKPPIEPLTREEVLMAEHAEREASGGGGFVVIRAGKDVNGGDIEPTCNMTYEEYKSNLKGFTLTGGVLLYVTGYDSGNDGMYPQFDQYVIESFEVRTMEFSSGCPIESARYNSAGKFTVTKAGSGPM